MRASAKLLPYRTQLPPRADSSDNSTQHSGNRMSDTPTYAASNLPMAATSGYTPDSWRSTNLPCLKSQCADPDDGIARRHPLRFDTGRSAVRLLPWPQVRPAVRWGWGWGSGRRPAAPPRRPWGRAPIRWEAAPAARWAPAAGPRRRSRTARATSSEGIGNFHPEVGDQEEGAGPDAWSG